MRGLTFPARTPESDAPAPRAEAFRVRAAHARTSRMPVTWSISDDGRLLSVTGRGVVTETEYLEAHAGFFAVSAGPDPPRCTLADWSGVTHMGFTSDTLWRSTSMTRAEVGPQMAGGRMAMVASSPSVYGMCRQWQAMIQDSSLECAVFQDRAEALAWLFRP